MDETKAPPTDRHDWHGPVADPGIAKPGFYVCRKCGLSRPAPADEYCAGAEAARSARAARVLNPNAWASTLDLQGVFLEWLFDPKVQAREQFDAVAALPADVARDLLLRVCYDRVMERIRSGELG